MTKGLLKMRAAVAVGAGDIHIRQLDVPVVQQGEVLIKVKAASICGSDVRVYKGEKAAVFPRIVGHEFSGEIVDMGEGHPEFHVGDRVTVEPVIPCSTCLTCQSGRPNVCPSRKVLGYDFDGGFAEFIKLPSLARGNVIRIPHNVSYEEAALSEPLSACLRGISAMSIRPGDSLAIIGGGPIGLMHLLIARMNGACPVVVVEPQLDRAKLAGNLGADYVITSPMGPEHEWAREVTRGELFKGVILSAAIPEAAQYSLHILRAGGTLNLFAGFKKGNSFLVDPNLIHYKEISVIGSASSTVSEMSEVLRLMEKGLLNVRPLITDQVPLASVANAIVMKMGLQGMKTIVLPEMAP